MRTIIIAFFWVNLSIATVKAQKFASKSLDVTPALLQQLRYEKDTNAHAYYVYDQGYTRFKYANTTIRSNDPSNKGYEMYFTRQFCIKILDETALDLANIEIDLYKNGSDKEEITELKATTYNLLDGKIIKEKLVKESTFKNETSPNWDVVKLAMPSVKKGSVIEVKYTVKSQFYFNLREWQFQRYIPIQSSEYIVAVPEYFNYNQTQKGYLPLDLKQNETSGRLTLTYIQVAEGAGQQGYTETETIDYKELVFHYNCQNVPAFHEEPYLTTPENYLSKVSFELSYTQFPHSLSHSYTTSWEAIANLLRDDERFGKQLERSGFIKDEATSISSKAGNPLEKMAMALRLIKQNIKWNNNYGLYTSQSLKNAFAGKSGNAADINLSLVALLKELGLEAYPVALSTRQHGIIHPSHASISSFNYVIASAMIDGNMYLMDATEPFAEIGTLPERCLNDKGRVITNSGGEWVNLNNKPFKRQVYFDLVLNTDYTLKGKMSIVETDQAAYIARKNIKKYTSKDEYIEKLQAENQGLIITSSKITGIDTLQGKITKEYNVVLSNVVEGTSEIIAFSPFFMEQVRNNPFKLESRGYPVEYPYTINETITTKITIPSEFTIESVPKSVIATIPDKTQRFLYNITQMEQAFIANSVQTINKVLYLPEEYPYVKEVYNQIVSKHSEKIVLKRKQQLKK